MRLRDSPARKVRILFQAACASEWCSSLFLQKGTNHFKHWKVYGKHNFATLARTDTFSSSRFTREWSMHICLPCANIASKITLSSECSTILSQRRSFRSGICCRFHYVVVCLPRGHRLYCLLESSTVNGSQLTPLINRFAIQTSLFPTRKWSVLLRFSIYHLWERGPSRLAFCDEETPFLMFGLPLYRVLVRKSWKYSFSATKSSRLVRLLPEMLFQLSLTA